MRVSVVTISYNQARFLTDCIESVINQDHSDVEYIVVDAGSTDGSREIIESYGSRISKTIFEPDAGPADGLRKGFDRATGDIYCYINADDLLVSGSIAKAVRYFQRNPTTEVLYAKGIQLDEWGKTVRVLHSSKWGLKRYAHGACNIVQQSTFFKALAYQRAGGFNVQNKICWDGELLVDMAISGAEFRRSKDILGGFRIYSTSITGSGMQQSKYFLTETQRISAKVLRRPPAIYDPILKAFFLSLKRISQPIVSLGNWLNR